MVFDGSLGSGRVGILLVALGIACAFEFVNGFHDTANAVATVIYTKSLKPWVAVIWSGLCNFLGVFVGGIAVAMAIVKLLPVDLLVSNGAGVGLSMVMALLLSAILWNLATWYMGIPASSSHALIGSILGVGLADSTLPGHVFGDGVNWHKAGEVGISLMVSPILGFGLAALLLHLSRGMARLQHLQRAPKGEEPPPMWVRILLIGTCTGVSFSHGSNDGQKGVGLVMLILVGILPTTFSVDTKLGAAWMDEAVASTHRIEAVLPKGLPVKERDEVLLELRELRIALDTADTVAHLSPQRRWETRREVLLVDAALTKWQHEGRLHFDPPEAAALQRARKHLLQVTDYAPSWVMFMVAISLGIGTMIGWKRIVITIGEKIGKDHLTYAQGASAELVAMSTIGVAAWAGLPVSTTHVLSSGVAGTMVAQGSGLQSSTVRNILLAWLLTLPVTMLLAAVLFRLFLKTM